MSTLIATRPPLLVEPVSRPGIDYTSRKQKGHDISASINYWKDPGDGSLPTPVNVSEYVMLGACPLTTAVLTTVPFIQRHGHEQAPYRGSESPGTGHNRGGS